MISLPKAIRSASPFSNIFAAGESTSNDIFILAIALKGISGQIGVAVGADVWTGIVTVIAAVVAPADAAITPIAVVVTT